MRSTLLYLSGNIFVHFKESWDLQLRGTFKLSYNEEAIDSKSDFFFIMSFLLKEKDAGEGI